MIWLLIPAFCVVAPFVVVALLGTSQPSLAAVRTYLENQLAGEVYGPTYTGRRPDDDRIKSLMSALDLLDLLQS